MWNCCIGMYTQRISSVFTGQLQIGVKRWEGQQPKRTGRWLRNHNLNTEKISSSVKIPRTVHCFGEPNAPENHMFRVVFTEKSLQILSSERRFSCPIEKGRYYVTLLDADDGW